MMGQYVQCHHSQQPRLAHQGFPPNSPASIGYGQSIKGVTDMSDETPRTWRKSSYSANSGNCVEVSARDNVAVRDSKQDGTGPVLEFTAAAWRVFLAAFKDGGRDL